ncbi:ABC transporter, substrate-binding protein, family 3 (plasmid) [Arthrobacter sp. ZXY-2]|uniref:substrate-binding periplasmic protein n=1 Tax=Paenarthrobacter ureafaciens TaxID=37931 RepID=UPI0008A6D639|nr:ABC transporter, substrate-binding protein, family 3 [Arthrobacter sp. ZXY-2]
MNRKIRHRSIVAAVTAITALAALTGCTQGSASSTAASNDSTSKLELITPGVLRVGVTGASQPYVYLDGSNKWIGFEPDLVQYAANKLGIQKVEYVQQDFSSLLAAVANGKYDIAAACIGVTDERKKTVDYVKDYNNGYLIFVAKSDSGISSAESLSGKRVGTITGSVQESYIKSKLPNTSAVGFPDNNTAIQSLLSGAVDSVFLDTETATNYTKQYPQLKEAYKVESTAPCAWPISKTKPNLKAALDDAVTAAINDGTVEKLTNQWIPNAPILPSYKPKP